MKISSFYQQAIRAVQLSLAALIWSIALNFGTTAPSLAAQWQVAPTPPLALFGWGEKAEGKVQQLVGKGQSMTGNKLEGTGNQIQGRGKADLGRVKDASDRTANQAEKMSKDLKKGIDKSLSKAGDRIEDTADNITNGVKKIIDN